MSIIDSLREVALDLYYFCCIYPRYLTLLADVYLPSAHGYADDTQLYMSFCPESSIAQNQAMLALEECITDMRSWLLTHKLMFKDSRTEFLIIGT